MTSVWIYVVVRGQMFEVQVDFARSLSQVFKDLRDEYNIPELSSCKPNDCAYQKLRVPVVINDELPQETLAACSKQDNWAELNYSTRAKALTSEWKAGYVYLVIELPFERPQNAIRQLNDKIPELFKRLQITVKSLRDWTEGDVIANGGVFLSANNIPRGIIKITNQLKQKRTYREDSCSELHVAKEYPKEFAKMFTPIAGCADPVVSNRREFVTFYNIIRCYLEDASRVASDSSSSLKASTFQTYLIQPPFFACSPPGSNFSYHEQMSWKFPIFISSFAAQDNWRKFTPNSDFSVISKAFLCPFIIAEIVSQPQEKDRYRMLVEGIAAVRAGRYLSKSDASRFFVVAIYLTANLHAERYILTEDDSGGSNKQVNIVKAEFDLGKRDDATQFLLEMFNLVAIIGQLERQLDGKKKELLTTIKSYAAKMLSLHSKGGSVTKGESSLRAIQEEDRASGAKEEDDLGVFDCEEVRSVLDSMDYEIGYVAFGHPNIATVVARGGGIVIGYLKYTKNGTKEVEILQYLSGITSPTNHTVHPIRVWPIQGGSIISMPVAGGWLTSLSEPSSHLWSVSQQLFEAVKFMHDHGVAHMDLKPPNIIIPPTYGQLTIIDFSLAVRLNAPQHTFVGLAGTEGYMAPEVGRATYNPIRADLWSCGKVIRDLCTICDHSPARTWLLEIAGLLLDDDPEKRPIMGQVLHWMSQHDAKSPFGISSMRTTCMVAVHGVGDSLNSNLTIDVQ